MSTEIPIQNVYYLLCYAWEQMTEGAVVDVGEAGRTEMVDLLAHVLAEGTGRVLRQGLDRDYVPQREDTSRIRGRIDVSTSLKRALFPRAQAHCRYDELSRNVLHNQILRSTLQHLTRVDGLADDLRSRLRRLDRRLAGVDTVPLSSLVFRRVQLHAGNAFYRFLMNVCDLVQRNTFAAEDGDGQRFRDFRRDDHSMGRVFERFVRTFYQHEQTTYQVHHAKIPWDRDDRPDARPDAADAAPHLPEMQTDVVLHSPDRTIILDTKFYRDTLQSHYRTLSYHSKHLYQLFAYVKNARAKDPSYAGCEGILLYPTVTHALDDEVWIQGHRLRVCTLDLAQDWPAIAHDLRALVGVDG
jgi:5-methylcytosine-specific restriction enzyme subunit McrC